MKKNIKLNNNIQFIYRKIDYIKTINIGIFVKCGSLDENKSNNGISHLIEHILFKGTTNRSAKEIALDIDKIGGDLNAYTTTDHTCFYLRILSDYLYEGLDVITDMISNSKFDENDLENEKQVIYDEIDNCEDDPEELASNELNKILFGENAYKHSILGSKTNLLKITKKSILEYINTYYNSSNIVISIVGNFNEEDLIDYIENIKIIDGKENKENKITKFNVNSGIKKIIIKDFEQITSYININNNINYKENEYETIIINNIFGNSVSSRLFQKIREDLGLTYSINSFIIDNGIDGNINIYFTSSNQNLKELNNKLYEIIDNFSSEDISKEEMDISKNQIISELIMNIEDPYEEMIINGERLILKNEIFDINKEIEKIKNIDILKLNKIKNEIFKINNYNSIYIGNLSKENIEYLNNFKFEYK